MNKELYHYEKGGHTFIKSSAELTQAEMAKSIDRFYRICAENSMDLPPLENEAEMLSLQNEIDKNGHYN